MATMMGSVVPPSRDSVKRVADLPDILSTGRTFRADGAICTWALPVMPEGSMPNQNVVLTGFDSRGDGNMRGPDYQLIIGTLITHATNDQTYTMLVTTNGLRGPYANVAAMENEPTTIVSINEIDETTDTPWDTGADGVTWGVPSNTTYTLKVYASVDMNTITVTLTDNDRAETHTASYTADGTLAGDGMFTEVDLYLGHPPGPTGSTGLTHVYGMECVSRENFDILLNGNGVNEAGAVEVGTFYNSDETEGVTYTYTLVSGTGSTDNALFSITDGALAFKIAPTSTGTKAIRVRCTDSNGVYYEEPMTITTVDTTAPVVTAFTIPSTGTDYSVTPASATATDAVGATHFKITEVDTKPTSSSAGWVAAASFTSTPYSIVTQNGTGTYTLYCWAKDAAGNVSDASISDSIDLTIS